MGGGVMARVEVKTSFFKDALLAVMQAEGDKIIERAFMRGRPMMKPISQEAAARIRDEFKTEYGGLANCFRPIVLHDIAPFVPAPETRCVFICEYCGSASESVNPCKNCLAPRTREQLELWARMGI